jgi:hypothetical protein
MNALWEWQSMKGTVRSENTQQSWFLLILFWKGCILADAMGLGKTLQVRPNLSKARTFTKAGTDYRAHMDAVKYAHPFISVE